MAAAQSPGENTVCPLPQALLGNAPLDPSSNPACHIWILIFQEFTGQCDKRHGLGLDSHGLIGSQEGVPEG